MRNDVRCGDNLSSDVLLRKGKIKEFLRGRVLEFLKGEIELI